jgi:hypothetical protein
VILTVHPFHDIRQAHEDLVASISDHKVEKLSSVFGEVLLYAGN